MDMLKIVFKGCQVLVLTFILSMACESYADTCQLDAPSQVKLPSYDPSTSYRSQYAFIFRVRAVTNCSVRLQIGRLDAVGEIKLVGVDIGGLRIGLSQDAAATIALQAFPNDLASWNLAAGQVVTYTIWMSPLTQQWALAGNYQTPLNLRLINAAGATLDEREIAIVAKAEAVSNVTFAGSGGRVARLDFGEISAGAKRTAVLNIRANTPYRIALTSQNNGYLQNVRLKDMADTKIAYTVRLSGQPLPLGAGTASVTVQNYGQTRHQFEVELGGVYRLLAGEYADDLLITVTAQ